MSVLSDIVTVTVDRPMGSCHPAYSTLRYPINYGYVEGILAPDGEYQDAYIVGVDKPVQTFTGKLIAIIHRTDDNEEKWVIAPKGTSFDAEQIRALVQFQEQYFASRISMISPCADHNNHR
ncbi:MAG: inorganic pyrophosphatase [Clostridia bacterium]|nr:inorganic pyrophosphatase [Clostridia bacterium]MBQ4273372.1 inorganic pyrophosphatase [Clostridia bacterium]